MTTVNRIWHCLFPDCGYASFIMAFINTFSKYYREKYQGPVGKIALDAGFVCPNREKGGCIYCAAQSFTPFYLEKGDDIATQLEKGRAYLKSKKFAKYFSYFQQETTTAAPLAELALKPL